MFKNDYIEYLQCQRATQLYEIITTDKKYTNVDIREITDFTITIDDEERTILLNIAHVISIEALMEIKENFSF